jgi:hypothetical protein
MGGVAVEGRRFGVRCREVERVATQRPFQAFEVGMVDGARNPIPAPESFHLNRNAIHAMDRSRDIVTLDIALITGIRVWEGEDRIRGS